jgi:hypothetical protein
VDARRNCLEARVTNRSGCFSIHRRIGSHLRPRKRRSGTLARLTRNNRSRGSGKSPLIVRIRISGRRRHQTSAKGNAVFLTVRLSRFSGGQGSRRLLKCVVGSHQASFLPSEEESFVMDYISQRTFERVPCPDLRFDR